jgi:hypothetical protein
MAHPKLPSASYPASSPAEAPLPRLACRDAPWRSPVCSRRTPSASSSFSMSASLLPYWPASGLELSWRSDFCSGSGSLRVSLCAPCLSPFACAAPCWPAQFLGCHAGFLPRCPARIFLSLHGRSILPISLAPRDPLPPARSRFLCSPWSPAGPAVEASSPAVLGFPAPARSSHGELTGMPLPLPAFSPNWISLRALLLCCSALSARI